MTPRTRSVNRSPTWMGRAQSSGGRSSSIWRATNLLRQLLLLLPLVSIQFCASCVRQKPEAEYRPTTTIKDLMDGIIDPAADTIWNSVATTITMKGKEEKAPHTDEEWTTVRRSALQLLEASNLLQIPGRHVAKPGG